jgi:modulator of FtsH protease HflC
MKVAKLIGCIVLVFLLSSSIFLVDETEQAVVVRMGNPVRIIAGDRGGNDLKKIKLELEQKYKELNKPIRVSPGAGLYFKWPLIENVERFEDRIIDYNSDPADIVTKDKKHLLVDNFARWRINDPLLFYETVRDEAGANSRLDNYIYSTLREELAKNDMIQIVRSSNRDLNIPDEKERPEITVGRIRIMEDVSRKALALGSEIGIEIVDVRIKRADLPKENEDAIFGRMRAERQRISLQYRSEGMESSQIVRSETDKQVKVMLAEATKKAEIIRGEADAKAAAIYASAYQKHSDFYTFMKALEASKYSMDGKTKIIVSTNSGLFQILSGKTPKF